RLVGGAAEHHGAEAKRRDLQAAAAEIAILHCLTFSSACRSASLIQNSHAIGSPGMWPNANASAQFHFVYLMRDRLQKNHIKIGYTTDHPEHRARQEDWRLYGSLKDGPRAIRIESQWYFRSDLSARFVEQAIIRKLRDLGTKEIDVNYN